MKKELLTPENVKKDLRKILAAQSSRNDDLYLSFLVPISMIAVLVGILFDSVWLGVLIFSLSGYSIYRWILDVRESRAKKKALQSALEKGDFSVSVETFSHVAEETVFEPHTSPRGKAVYTKAVYMFYFVGGSSWRVPLGAKHYDWSLEYSLSREGLLNTSVKGNKFFVIRLRNFFSVSYAYPAKFFELGEELKKHPSPSNPQE